MKKLCKCGNKKDVRSKNCRVCASKLKWLGEKNPNYKHGKTNNTFCIDCNKRIDRKCKRCWRCYKIWGKTSENNGNYKDGKYSKSHKNRCPDCNRIISNQSNKCRSCATKKIWKNLKYRNKIITSIKRNYKNPKFLRKFKKTRQLLWSNEKFKNKMLRKMIKAQDYSQNKIEQKLEKLLNKIFSKEYKFVGDGKIFIARFVPDFININGQKKIIELFGDYWHKNTQKRDKYRIKTYKKYGYKTLIVWEHELKDKTKLTKKLMSFNNV